MMHLQIVDHTGLAPILILEVHWLSTAGMRADNNVNVAPCGGYSLVVVVVWRRPPARARLPGAKAGQDEDDANGDEGAKDETDDEAVEHVEHHLIRWRGHPRRRPARHRVAHGVS